MIKRTLLLAALLLLSGCRVVLYSVSWDARPHGPPYEACEPYCDEDET